MADKKKMSVADILAAARKTDGGDTAGEESAPAESAAPAEKETAETETTDAAAAKPAGNVKPAKSASGGRLSVAEMMAMARGEKAGGAAKKPAAKTPTAGKPKPAAKTSPPSKAAAAKAAPAEPRDTASILAAARKSSKAGPMSKAEAAAKAKADPKAKTKPKIVVPPMPVKPAYAMPTPAAAKSKSKSAAKEERRDFLWIGFGSLAAVTAIWSLASLKFMFPNVRREPPSKFKVGFPDAYPAGQVQTKFKAQYGVWIANAEYNGQLQIYALKSVCTHLGCTPSWLDAEQKYKCPCHGSGFYKDGINFEGPAPRPLERCAIRIADDGQIEVDKSRIFQEEMGQWEDPSCYISV